MSHSGSQPGCNSTRSPPATLPGQPSATSKIVLHGHSETATRPWFPSRVFIVDCPRVGSHPLDFIFLSEHLTVSFYKDKAQLVGALVCVDSRLSGSSPHSPGSGPHPPCNSLVSARLPGLAARSLRGPEPWGLGLGCWCNKFHRGLNYIL